MANNIVLYNVVYIYMCLCVYICTKHCVLQIFNSNYCEREKEKKKNGIPEKFSAYSGCYGYGFSCS